MGNKMESSIFVSASFKGVFWHFKVDRRILLTLTVVFFSFYCYTQKKLETLQKKPYGKIIEVRLIALLFITIQSIC